jgi:hypothetical protein
MTHIFCTLLNRSTVGIDGIEQYCTMCNLEATASALHSRAPLPIVNGAEGSIIKGWYTCARRRETGSFFFCRLGNRLSGLVFPCSPRKG